MGTWLRNLLVLVVGFGSGVSACSQRQGAGPGTQAIVDAAVADSSAGGDVADSIEVADGGSDTAGADAGFDVPAQDVGDVFDPATMPSDVTWTTAAWASVCVPEGATVTTLGPIGAPPSTCKSHDCALCGPKDQCTCEGDGNTGCAWRPIAPLPFPLQEASHVWGDGKLFIWGGSIGFTEYPSPDPFQYYGHVQTAEIWDPKTNGWTVTAHAPVYGLESYPGVAYGQGKLYVGGSNVAYWQQPGMGFVGLPWGPTYADLATYDVAAETWTALPTAGSPGACGEFGGMAFIGGTLIVPGCAGYTAAKLGVGPPASFDPLTGKWTPLPQMPVVSYYPWQPDAVSGSDVGGLVYDKKGHVTGLMIFHATSWTWSLHPFPSTCINSEPGGARITAFADGFLVSHFGLTSVLYIWWKEAEAWEPVPVPQWLTVQDELQTAFDGNDFLMWERGGAAYDPIRRRWRRLAEFGQPSYRGDAVLATSGQRAQVIGGFDVGWQASTSSAFSLLVPSGGSK